ncbi:hypothetical protein HYZ82_01425 [Candidatus Nomurabacteria bacterium]|nr:hypothetical protein [Candidatus Nomurabacteria bacterium]
MAENANKNTNEDTTDLSGALKGSNDVGKFQSANTIYPETPKIIGWVTKYSGGLIKDVKQANYVLIVFSVIAIIISLILFLSSVSPGYNYKGKMILPGRAPSVN